MGLNRIHYRGITTAAATGLLLSIGSLAAKADFPEKPIELVIPFGAGGGADIEGRLLAKEMGKVLGVQIVPINKPGAGGAVTYTYIKNAKPDGYKIAWNSTSILTTTNIGNVPFMHDAMDHIGRVEWQPMVFAVKGDAKWRDFKSFAADCKANPDKLKVSNSGTGSATHLAAIALANATGCKVVHLPVGIKRRNASVLSGEADAMAAPLTGAIRLNKAGKMRILAVISGKRNAAIPKVPTAKELGFDAQLDLFRGLSVPKGTPASVKKKLGDAMAKAAKSDAFTKLAKQKGFTVDPMMSADFSKLLAVEDKRVKSIMNSAGLYQSKAK
ncbi:MAG: Bug family tripartite tricarboxylate transporter substrate binding protein [Hyphomicrobiaceae bacterium]